jgi:hypothetical protein
VNDELEETWKEAVMVCLSSLSGGTEESHGNPQSE